MRLLKLTIQVLPKYYMKYLLFTNFQILRGYHYTLYWLIKNNFGL